MCNMTIMCSSSKAAVSHSTLSIVPSINNGYDVHNKIKALLDGQQQLMMSWACSHNNADNDIQCNEDEHNNHNDDDVIDDDDNILTTKLQHDMNTE